MQPLLQVLFIVLALYYVIECARNETFQTSDRIIYCLFIVILPIIGIVAYEIKKRSSSKQTVGDKLLTSKKLRRRAGLDSD